MRVRYCWATAVEAAFPQDFKSQAAAAASQWDSAFDSGDASKVAQGYTKSAVILPAGGQQVTGQQGAEALFGNFIKGGVKSHKITVEGGEQKGDLGYAYGRWEADAGRQENWRSLDECADERGWPVAHRPSYPDVRAVEPPAGEPRTLTVAMWGRLRH